MDKYEQILKKYNYSPDQLVKGGEKNGTSPSERIAELQGLSQEQETLQTGGILGKISDFVGTTKLGQGIATAIRQPQAQKELEERLKSQSEIQGALIQRIKEKRDAGEDTARLEGALNDITQQIRETGENAGLTLNPFDLTTKEVLGSALQTGVSAFGASALPGALGKATAAQGIKQGLVQGAKTGAIEGALFGGGTGVAQGLLENEDADGIVESGIVGTGLGSIGGGVIGGLLGGISGGIAGRELRKQVLDSQISLGQKSLDSITPIQQKAKDIALRQGIEEKDVDFLLTLNKKDKEIGQKMVELAENATKNSRATTRPIDIVGENFVDRIKYVETVNKRAGALVEDAAKQLKGQNVDTTPIRERALQLLEDAGVTANPDGTPNWSDSIFNKTPQLKNKIMQALSDLPAGETDAYRLHQFKKSIDEVVDFGTGGEGLKGRASRILKAIRNQTDSVLDSNFEIYNRVNTDYRKTREVIDSAIDLFGKKSGFSKERGGQLLRNIFSNNTNRPRVMKFAENLDLIAKEYGADFEGNLLDQTILTEILEDIYGTQATTSLQGQVQRAVSGAKRIIEGVRNPIKGIGELTATATEKALGISPERRKEILNAFLK